MAADERGRRNVAFVLGLAVMAVGWLGWLAGHALQAAVSRQREFLADARAVQWTRNRDGLGRVLRKALWLSTEGRLHQRMDEPAVQHMLLLSTESGRLVRWLDSHPPLTLRIERIYGGRMPALSCKDGREPDHDIGYADTLPGERA